MEKREIIRKQLDEKLYPLQAAAKVSVPASGWIYAMRYALYAADRGDMNPLLQFARSGILT